mgnify:CR=1 FL=1
MEKKKKEKNPFVYFVQIQILIFDMFLSRLFFLLGLKKKRKRKRKPFLFRNVLSLILSIQQFHFRVQFPFSFLIQEVVPFSKIKLKEK